MIISIILIVFGVALIIASVFWLGYLVGYDIGRKEKGDDDNENLQGVSDVPVGREETGRSDSGQD